jgi:hypothetical protein
VEVVDNEHVFELAMVEMEFVKEKILKMNIVDKNHVKNQRKKPLDVLVDLFYHVI